VSFLDRFSVVETFSDRKISSDYTFQLPLSACKA
jgi:hypothetical protein